MKEHKTKRNEYQEKIRGLITFKKKLKNLQFLLLF